MFCLALQFTPDIFFSLDYWRLRNFYSNKNKPHNDLKNDRAKHQPNTLRKNCNKQRKIYEVHKMLLSTCERFDLICCKFFFRISVVDSRAQLTTTGIIITGIIINIFCFVVFILQIYIQDYFIILSVCVCLFIYLFKT